MSTAINVPWPEQRKAQLLAVAGAALALVVLAGLADTRLLLAAALGLPLAAAVLAWPNFSTMVVLFLLYINAPVVLVRFHNVPFAVAAAIPLLLAVPLTYYLLVRREKITLDANVVMIGLFMAIQLLGTAFSTDTAFSLGVLATTLTEGWLLYFLILNVVRTPEMLRTAIWVLLAAGAVMGGLSCYQQVTGTFDRDYGGFAQLNGAFEVEHEAAGSQVQQRLAGPIGEKNRYAQILLMLVPLGAFFAWGERSAGIRLVAGTATALIAAGTALTFSRGAAVGFVLMALVTACMGYIRVRQLAAVAIGAAVVLLLVPQYRDRLASMVALTAFVAGDAGSEEEDIDGNIKGRLTEMAAAGLVFADHPVIGVGPGMFKFYAADYSRFLGIEELEGNRLAHNLYLHIAAEYGIVGCLCFASIVLSTLASLIHVRRTCGHVSPQLTMCSTALVLAIVSYLATGVFLHFSYVRYFWLVLALAGACCQVARTLQTRACREYPSREIPPLGGFA